jgi:ankyrin repeat protein
MAAANFGHLDMVKYLISKGANVNSQASGFVFEYLKKNRPDEYNYKVKRIPNGGDTPLTSALWGAGDWLEIVEYLLENGAKINFNYVSRNCSQVIYQNGIALYGEGTMNFQPTLEEIDTPLTRITKNYINFTNVTYKPKAKLIIELLLKLGADKNGVDGKGNTAYDIALTKGAEDILEILKP